jgi:sugar/nucleoside kinase (ribokinase family)
MPVERARIAFKPIIDAADVLMPTAEEARLLTGEASIKMAIHTLLADLPERVLILTEGKQGCRVYRSGAAPLQVAGFVVDEVDPTGAGDCFDAGFLTRWLAGDTLKTAARFANACGALAVTAQGPMAGAQTHDRVMAFISQQTHN